MASIPECPQWSSLLPDLLGQLIDHLPHVVDRARFRAVCRSWHSAVRLHPARQRLPWIVLEDGTYLTPSDGGIHRLPFPKNARCVGSTGAWIAFECTDEVARTHTYTLHNHFTGVTVPLPELDAIIGKATQSFKVRKVLMRSTPDDLIAVMGNIWKYPLILCQPGKGAWVPRLVTIPYFLIIDVAFLGDKLYAISKAEDLFAINLGEDNDGRPIVTTVKQIIRHAPGHDDDQFDDGVWRLTDVDASSDEDTEEELDDEPNSNAVLGQDDAPGELVGDNDDGYLERFAFIEEATLPVCDEGVTEGYNAVNTSRHLVVSRGKLIMVKRVLEIPAFEVEGNVRRTRKVEVFEADMEIGAWVPLNGGLSGGQAIFISNHFCSTVSASGEIEEDIIYFPDTNDVFDMRSRIIKALPPMDRLSGKCYWRAWVFSPDLVV